MSSDTIEKLIEEFNALFPTLPSAAERGISVPLKELRHTARILFQILESQLIEFRAMKKTYDNLTELCNVVDNLGWKPQITKIRKNAEKVIEQKLIDKVKLNEYVTLRERFASIIRRMLRPLHHEIKLSELRNITGFRGMRTHVTPSYNPSNYPTSENRYLQPPEIGNITDMEFIPNRSRHSAAIRNSYLVPEKKTPVFDAWIKAQRSYLKSLSNKDKSLLRGYTYYGDTLLNSYCRGGLQKDLSTWVRDFNEKVVQDFTHPIVDDPAYASFIAYAPFIAYLMYDNYQLLKEPLTLPPKPPLNNDVLTFLSQVFENNKAYFSDSDHIVPLLEQFKRELIRIISEAPRPSFPLTVYRGFKSEKHLTSATYTNKDFISTSINIEAALAFGATKEYNYMIGSEISADYIPKYYGGFYELTVTPGTPCLYISPISFVGDSEREILFMPGMTVELENIVRYKDVSLINDRWAKGSVYVSVINGTIHESPTSKRATNYVWNAVNMAPVSYKSARKTRMDKGSREGRNVSKGRKTFKQSRQTRLNRTLSHLHNS